MSDSMVLVEGGCFQMGDDRILNEEIRVHQAEVPTFYMDAYPVTQKLYESVTAKNPSFFKGENNPVDGVSWYDAVRFCNEYSKKCNLDPVYDIAESDDDITVTCDFSKNGYRLPTEAEWEYCAKGGAKTEGYLYSGSNKIREVGWFINDSEDSTHPVGQKKANELGIYDMSGNIYEWCWDWFSPYKEIHDNHLLDANRSAFKCARGGCYKSIDKNDGPTDYYVFTRHSYPPNSWVKTIGFRLVRGK